MREMKGKGRMSNFIKKTFTWGVVVATMVMTLNFTAFTVADAAQAGDLIKMAGNSALYLLGDDGKRYVFPNDKSYFTWYTNFTGVVTVSQSELQSYPIGGNVCYKPGTRLVKITTDPKAYAVEPGCKLRWVTSEQIAMDLYGSNWAKKIDDVSDAFFVNYSVGADVTTATYTVGSLVMETGNSTIYYIADNMTKRPFASEAAMTANRFKMGDVLNAAAGKLASYSMGTSVTGKEDALATYKGVSGGGPVGAGGTLSIALSPKTPPQGTAVAGAARLPFTAIDMTATGGDVMIDALTVQRGGIAQDGVFADLTYLVDGKQVGLNKTLNAQHQSTLYDDITVSAGMTKTLWLTGNTASSLTSYAGENPTLGLVSVVLKQGAMSGNPLPIYGNQQTVNSTVTIAAVTAARGGLDPGAASTQKIGTKQFNFTSLKLSNGSQEEVQVEEIIWDQAGSADDTDISNVAMVVDGVVVASMQNPVNKKAHFKLSPPLKIGKGLNKEFTIRADIDSGSNRTVDFDIEKNTDVVAKGLTYGFYVLPTGWPSSTDPRLSGYAVTIDTGSLKIEPVATASNKIAEGATKQILGKFNFEAKGEEVNVTTLGIQVSIGAGSSATIADITNVTLYNTSGTAVAGPKDPTGPASTALFGNATTTDTITVPVGKGEYTVKADLNSDFTAGDTVSVNIIPGTNVTAKGVTTGKTVTPTPGTTQTSTTQTVQVGSLTASVATTPTAATVVAGTNGYTFANLVFGADSSGEDVRVTQIKLAQHTTGAAYPALISGLKLYDGSTELLTSNDPDPTSTTATASATSTFTFVNAFVVSKSTSKTLTLKGNISKSVTSGTVAFGLQSDGASPVTTVAATGKDTGNTITATYSYADGQAMTLTSAGTLTLSADASTPIAGLLAGNSTGLTVGVLGATAQHENVNLEKVYFSIADINSGGPDQFDKVWLTDGTKTVGVTPTSSDSATSPVTVLFDMSNDPFVVMPGSNKLFTIKVDTSVVDRSNTSKGSPGVGFQVSVNATGDITAKGASSGNNATITGTPTFNAFTLYRSVPVVDTSSGVTNKLTTNGVYELFKFKITADPKAPIGAYKFTYGLSTTTVTASSFELWDSNKSDSSIGSVTTATRTGGTDPPSNYQLEFLFDTDGSGTGNGGEFREISAGETRTFTMKGTVSGYSSSVSNGVNVVLAGDAAFASTVVECAGTTTGNNACTGVDSDDQDDFIWSGLDFTSQYNTSSATNTAEWTNGFRVKGLQSTSSTAQAI